MSVAAVDLSLASAVLTGGARVAAAVGSILPQRITTEQDYYVDGPATTTFGIIAIMMCSDNSSDFIITSNGTVKRSTKTGGLVWNTGVGNVRSISPSPNAGKILCSRDVAAAATFAELNEATGALLTFPISPVSGQKQILYVPGGTPDRLWYSQGSASVVEFAFSTGAATGRSIAVTSFFNMVGGMYGGVPAIFVQETNLSIKVFDEATLTLQGTWSATLTVGNTGLVGTNFGNCGMWIAPDGRLLIKADQHQCFDFLPALATTNLQTLANQAVVRRAIWGSSEIAGPMANNPSGGSQLAPGFSITPDRKYLGWITSSPTPTNSRASIVRNIQDQTAEWTLALSGQTSWVGVDVPGNLVNSFGVFPPSWNAGVAADLRSARFYYQRVGLDGSPVFLPHGAYVAPSGISLVGASALKIGFVFNRGFERGPGLESYVGGPSGEGPRLWLENGVTPHRNRLFGSM